MMKKMLAKNLFSAKYMRAGVSGHSSAWPNVGGAEIFSFGTAKIWGINYL